MAKANAAVLAAMSTDVYVPPPEKVTAARELAKKVRDLRLNVADWDEQSKEAKKVILDIERNKLPEMLQELKLRGMDLEAEGNLPAYSVKLKPYYFANIKADWSDEEREAAFKYLEDRGDGDLIKTVIMIELPRGERKTAIRVEKALDKLKVPYTSEKAVHSATLTAWLKELVEVHKEVPPLETLGASVGNMVSVKPIKEKR